MKKISNTLLILIVSIVFFSSCNKDKGLGALYTPAASDTTANATLEELQQGKTLYVNNCGACHNYKSPDDYSPSNWKNILANMVPKTDLTQTEAILVTKYVTKGNL